MKIINHRLCNDDGTPYPFRASPNLSGGALQPQFLVMHYTAGRNFDQSVNWLTNPASKASAHLVIGRDGSIMQLAGFDQVTWHAGRSSWQGINGLNSSSIGIELDNAGVLTRSPNGKWYAWFGDEIDGGQVIEATHKNESTPRGWQLFTPEQLFIALEVASALVDFYRLRDILGHDDIAPGRKTDPGPAFPMQTFRNRLFGRRDDSSATAGGGLYITTANLHIRSGAGQEFQPLPNSPLPSGTRIRGTGEEQGDWLEAEVLDDVKGLRGAKGWVNKRFIAAG